jgi:DNA topoisomerase I
MPKSKRIYRHKQGRGFSYKDGNGQPVQDKQISAFIESLVIPPAWEKVEINPNPKAKIHATGYDEAGRKQYAYNQEWRAKRDREKFDRIIAFANALPMMRKITGDHLRHRSLDRQKVMAAMVRLIDMAYFRVGNERYAKENQTFGLSTMRSRHLKIEGNKLIFHYVGKSHKEHVTEVVDPTLARIVRELDHLPGYEIFKYYNDAGRLVDVSSDDLNAYIKEVMGYDFSAKDFRTWAATLIAAVALSDVDDTRVCSATQAKRNVTQAVKIVSEKLGNTPAIARASYIDPRVIDHYLSGYTIKNYLRRIKHYLDQHELLAQEEICVLKLLQKRLRRQGAKETAGVV